MAADVSWVRRRNAHRGDRNAGRLGFVGPILRGDAVARIDDDAVNVLGNQLVDVVSLRERVEMGIEIDGLCTELLGGFQFAVLQCDRVGKAQALMRYANGHRLVGRKAR